MGDAVRYRQEQEFVLDELRAKRGEVALARALQLRIRTLEFRIGVMTVEELEEAIARREKSK